MVLAKVTLGLRAAGRMTFWVIRQGNPEVNVLFLNTPSPKIGRGTGVGGVLVPEARASAAAYAVVAGSGAGPVYMYCERMRRWCDGELCLVK